MERAFDIRKSIEQCPACLGKFEVTFTFADDTVGGKNDHCPHCHALGWYPTAPEEKAHLVPVPLLNNVDVMNDT